MSVHFAMKGGRASNALLWLTNGDAVTLRDMLMGQWNDSKWVPHDSPSPRFASSPAFRRFEDSVGLIPVMQTSAPCHAPASEVFLQD